MNYKIIIKFLTVIAVYFANIFAAKDTIIWGENPVCLDSDGYAGTCLETDENNSDSLNELIEEIIENSRYSVDCDDCNTRSALPEYTQDYDPANWEVIWRDVRNRKVWWYEDGVHKNSGRSANWYEDHCRDQPLRDFSEIKKPCWIISIYPKDGFPYNNAHISAYVFGGSEHSSEWQKPLLFSDGFDPGGERTILEVLDPLLPLYLHDAELGTFQRPVLTNEYVNKNGIIYVDYDHGAGLIDKNARALLRLLQEINPKAIEDIVVSGWSMGGVVSRLAILYGERNDVKSISRVKKLITIDSPNQGAAVNIDFQNTVKKLKKKYGNLSWLPVMKIKEAASMLELVYYHLGKPAALQMLYNNLKSGYIEGELTFLRTEEHKRFYKFIRDMGDYPRITKNIGISMGSWGIPYPVLSKVYEQENYQDYYQYTENIPFAKTISNIQCKQLLISHNFSPGSFADIYKKFPDLTAPALPNLYPNVTRYFPTFIPIYSALDIKIAGNDDFYIYDKFNIIRIPANQRQLDEIAYRLSKMDKLYVVDFNRSHSHYDFNSEAIEKYIEAIKCNVYKQPDPAVTNNLLLLGR